MIRRCPALALSPVLALAAVACQESSSSPAPAPAPEVINLGVASSAIRGTGDLRLLVVPEQDQGRDLNGDGDQLDGGFFRGAAFGVVHVADLEQHSVVNTGLVLAVTRPLSAEISPRTIADEGPSLAFGVDESLTGELDRNGDGDATDFVLAIYDRQRGEAVNLGLAVDRVVADDPIIAFDVRESDQGQDLDGDGIIGSGTVPFVHDLRSRTTWNTELAGRRVLDVIGLRDSGILTVVPTFVALAADESVLGDRNGDGDDLDLVFEVYETTSRTLQPVGIALQQGFGQELAGPPVARGGRWAITVSERDQGSDLNGDGDALDLLAVLYDPGMRQARVLGPLIVTPAAGVEPLALFDAVPPPFGPSTLWLYDRMTDLLADTGFSTVGLSQVGARVVMDVPEEQQGEDLDRNGALESFVPVLYDLRSGRTQNLGVDGFALQPLGDALLLRSREAESRRDWNGDGDQDDVVLFVWDEERGRLSNTRLSPVAAGWLDERTVLLALSEAERSEDLNGDGDLEDEVLHAYDVPARRLRSLGIDARPFQGLGRQPLLFVDEARQGLDLNGDGDQLDQVLQLVVSGS